MGNYENELEKLHNQFYNDPNQLPLFKFWDARVIIGDWRPVKYMKVEEYQNMLEVIGFNPAWIDLDCNPNGLRICCWTGEYWSSAHWCMYHDQYEHRPADTDDEYAPQHAPIFICHLPAIHPQFQKLIDAYLNDEGGDQTALT